MSVNKVVDESVANSVAKSVDEGVNGSEGTDGDWVASVQSLQFQRL